MNETAAPAPARKPWLARIDALAAWFGDRANPLLVRYVRQELRNRRFFAIYALLLTVSCLASIIFLGNARQGVDSGGLHLVGVLCAALSFALWVAQPMGAYRGLAIERDDDTWDLIDLTGMRPGKLLRGMLLAGLVQGMLYTSAIAPFLVLAWLIASGIDIITLVLLLVGIQMLGVVLSSWAVFWACLGPNKSARGFLGLVLFLGLAGYWAGMGGVWFELDDVSRDVARLSRSEPLMLWTLVFCILNVWVQHLVLTQSWSKALLTFRADNRSSGPRGTWLLLFANGLVLCLVLPWLLPLPFVEIREVLAMSVAGWSLAAVIGALLLGAFALSEDYELSPRQARWIRTAGRGRRLVSWALGPGAARGRACFLAFLGLSLGIATAGVVGNGGTSAFIFVQLELWIACLMVAAYGCILLVISDRLYRGWLARVFDTPGSRRAFTLLVAAIFGICPLLFAWLIGDQAVLNWVSPIGGLLEIPSIHGRILGETGLSNASHPAVPPGLGMVELVGACLRGFPLGAMIILGLGFWAALVLLLQAVRRWTIHTVRVHAGAHDHNPRGG